MPDLGAPAGAHAGVSQSGLAKLHGRRFDTVGDAELRQLHTAAIPQKNRVRANVPMHHPGLMHMVKRRADLGRNRRESLDIDRLGKQSLSQ